MRRQDIQLRLLAKQGDTDACLKLGEAYLTGTSGFARNIPVSLSYLRSALPQSRRAASECAVHQLQLQDILEFDALDMLEIAAETSDAARLKLAAWCLICGDRSAFDSHIARCSETPLRKLTHTGATQSEILEPVLRSICTLQPMNVADVLVRAARVAMSDGDLKRTLQILSGFFEPYEGLPPSALQLVVDVVRHAERTGQALTSVSIGLIEVALEKTANGGDIYACHTLGRALAGIRCGELPPERLVSAPQQRKAAALLLRAADAGTPEAWLHLYRICSDYRGSVANPLMARFCLEKAALRGLSEAERRLGALELREATEIESMEKALSNLFSASRKGDAIAKIMLKSLVLPVAGSEAQAEAGLLEVQRAAPVLAMRLRLARHFGLTKLEALSVNPANGRRSWGLVVERNPFVVKMRLAEPRAVPAVSAAALECLERTALMFGGKDTEDVVSEAPLRARSLQQRRLFERLHLDEDLYFASATSQQRDAIRVGTKWAQKQRQTLQMALAD